jgi:aminomethyltransferase
MTHAHTALHFLHRRRGARFVDFAGWEMPLHYGSQIEEHLAVRADAGMFDVSHMRVLDVAGRGARLFLRHALANDIDKLTQPGRALYSCMLDEWGGVLDDLIVYFVGEDAYRLVLNAATAGTDFAWLSSLAGSISGEVRIIPRSDVSMIAVQGPHARAKCGVAITDLNEATQSLAPFGCTFHRDYFIGRTGYTGEDGFEIVLPTPYAAILWEHLEQIGVRPCGLGARDTLRIEAGMALYRQDMDASVTPIEAGLGWTVDTSSSRDFVGRASLATREPRFKRVGLVLLEPGVLRADQIVTTAHGEGIITSGSYAPSLKRSIAFARVPIATQVGEHCSVKLRDRLADVVVTRYPFVRYGQSLVDDVILQASPTT